MSQLSKSYNHHQKFFRKKGEKNFYKKGDQIVINPTKATRWVFFLDKGMFKVSIFIQDDTERIIGYIKGRSTFANTISFNKKGYDNIVYTALDNSVLYKLPANLFVEEVSKNDKLMQEYLTHITLANMFLVDRIIYQGSKGTELKFINWLLFMKNYYGQTQKNMSKISVPLTQDDIANLLNTTRESVNKTSRLLTMQNIIKSEKKHILILNLRKLKKISQSTQN